MSLVNGMRADASHVQASQAGPVASRSRGSAFLLSGRVGRALARRHGRLRRRQKPTFSPKSKKKDKIRESSMYRGNPKPKQKIKSVDLSPLSSSLSEYH